jgi:hypothetical protein
MYIGPGNSRQVGALFLLTWGSVWRWECCNWIKNDTNSPARSFIYSVNSSCRFISFSDARPVTLRRRRKPSKRFDK